MANVMQKRESLSLGGWRHHIPNLPFQDGSKLSLRALTLNSIRACWNPPLCTLLWFTTLPRHIRLHTVKYIFSLNLIPVDWRNVIYSTRMDGCSHWFIIVNQEHLRELTQTIHTCFSL